MSDTPRTEAVNQYLRTRRDYTKTDHEVWMNHGIQIERELNAANERIKSLIEERDRANRLADWKWNLRGEFESLLGTDNIEKGIKAVKEMKQRIKRLEEAGQRVDDAAHSIQDWSGTVLGDALDELNKAKEAKP